MDEPIEVSAPITEQLWSAARTIAVAGGTFALGRGWIEQDTAVLLGAVGVTLWGVIAGQLKTWERSRKLVTLAQAVPDAVALVKGRKKPF